MLKIISQKITLLINHEAVLGKGDNRTVTELSFAHVTTKIWAYSGVFSFLRFFLVKTKTPSPKERFQNKMENPFIFLFFLPSGLMISISRFVHMSVCLSVCLFTFEVRV